MYYDCMSSHRLLREARRRAGLTQAELGERVGRAPSAISRWERGEVEPSLESLRFLIRAAGFDLVIGLNPTDDHDLVLIRRSLARSPAARMAELVTAVQALDAMAAAGG
jgi:transcriptional regulator with XRE-family HTH domain